MYVFRQVPQQSLLDIFKLKLIPRPRDAVEPTGLIELFYVWIKHLFELPVLLLNRLIQADYEDLAFTH